MRNRKLEGMIGLAARAGKVRSGEFGAEESVKSGKAAFCLLAEDASAPTIKKFEDMCRFRNIPVYRGGFDKISLGRLIGREERAVLTVEDQNMAAVIAAYYEGGNACGYRE